MAIPLPPAGHDPLATNVTPVPPSPAGYTGASSTPSFPAIRRPGEPAGVVASVPLPVVEKLLASQPMLQLCDPSELAEIAAQVRPYECPAGATLLEADAPIASIGFLVTGMANAIGRDADDGAAVEPLSAPDVFGETAALGVERPNYSVVAVTVCRVLSVPIEVIRRLIILRPGLVSLLTQRMARRFDREHQPADPFAAVPQIPPAAMPAASAAPAATPASPAFAPSAVPGVPGMSMLTPSLALPTAPAAPMPAPQSASATTSAPNFLMPPHPAPPPPMPAAPPPPFVNPPSGLPPMPPPPVSPSSFAPPHLDWPDPLATTPHAPQSYPQRPQTSPHMQAVSAHAAPAPQPPPAHAAPQPQPPPGARYEAPPMPATEVIRFVEIGDFELTPTVLSLLPPKLIRQHRLFPLQLTNRRLTVGLVAPRNLAAVGELRRALHGLEVEVVAISMDDFAAAIVRHKIDDKGAQADGKRVAINPETMFFDTAEAGERDVEKVPKAMGDDVVRLVNRLIALALDRDASDIHLEPVQSGLKVRFRINGIIHESGETVQPAHARGVVARVKILAGLDITERRRPQDGRIGLRVGRREIDVRVSCLPSARGEKLVLRILDNANSMRPLAQVFVDPRILNFARRALNRPYGGIVVAGATGAGKTSTVYAMLHERRMSRPDTHITMVEDPIEYRVEGVTQVQVDLGAGLSFAQVLRSMLRQDPDVIVVGEMRDTETARIGLEAAMTGHVLITSLHANNSLSALQRLEQLDAGRPLISLSLALVLVQRLVRKLCGACRRPVEAPRALYDSLLKAGVLEPGASNLLPTAVGCDACGRTGFVGRQAVFEALALSDDVRALLAAGSPLADVGRLARETGALIPFSACAGFLLREGHIGASEALLTVAD